MFFKYIFIFFFHLSLCFFVFFVAKIIMNKTKLLKITDISLDIGITLLVASFTVTIVGAQVGFYLAFISLIARMIINKKWELKLTDIDKPIIAFISVMIVSALLSLDVPASLIKLGALAQITIVYSIGYGIKDEEKIKRLLWILTGVNTLVSIYGIANYILGKSERIMSTQFIYMTLSGLLMISLCLSIAVMLFGLKEWKSRLYLAIMNIIIILCLLLTFTRSSWLGLIGGILIMSFLREWKILPPMIIILTIFYFLLPNEGTLGKDRIRSIIDPYHKKNIERLYMWRAGWRVIKDYPLLGVGPMDTEEIQREYKLPEAKEVHGHFHNNFVQIGVNLGFIGLSIFIWLLATLFWYNIRLYYQLRKKQKIFLSAFVLGTVAALSAFIINGLFEWNFGDAEISFMLWYVIGMGLAINRLINNDEIVISQE